MMGGSAAVPGSTELLTLLQVLADPAAAKATIANLVAATEAVNAARVELETERANKLQVLGQRDQDSEYRARVAAEAEQKAADAQAGAQAEMARLDGEYATAAKTLKERTAVLDQRETNLKSAEFDSATRLNAREAAVARAEADVAALKAQAEADASAAAAARETYERKLQDLTNQLQKIAG